MATKSNKPARDPRAVAAAAAAVIETPQAPQAATRPKGHAGAKVFVFSKMPMALELQLCKPKMTRMRVKEQAWDEPVYIKFGPVVVIAGNNYPIGAPPPEVFWPERPPMVAGYAITKGVDKEFWDAWFKDHAEDPMVVNCLIFAEEKLENGTARARDNKARFTGLGPLLRGKDKDGEETIIDPRQPKKLVGNSRPRPAAEDADNYMPAADLLAAE